MKAGALALALLLCAAVPGFARRELLQGNDMSSVTYTFSPSTSSPSPSGDSSPSPSPSAESSPSPSPSGDSSPSPSPSGESSPSPSPSGESSPSPSNYSPSPSSNPIATVAEETPAASSSPPSRKSSSATSAQGCQTALSYLKDSDEYGMLLQLINATPKKEHLADILDSPDVAIALLAPSDYGVNRTLNNNGLSFKELLSDPTLVLEVIQYHMLPNTVPVDQLLNGYSFNTLLPGDNFQDSVTIARNGEDITIRGAKNDAKLLDTGTSTCLSMVYELAEMLLPRASVADAPAESATESAEDLPLQAGAALPLEGDEEASGTVITPRKKFAHGPTIAAAHAPAAAAGVKRIQAAAVAPAAKAPAAAAKKPAVAAKAPAVAPAVAMKPAAIKTKPVAAVAPAVAPAGALPEGTVTTASVAGP